MSSLSRSLLACVVVLGLSSPAFAQPKVDAGSGPTSGVTSTKDAGSGPTKGAKPNSASTGGSQPVTPATPEKKQ